MVWLGCDVGTSSLKILIADIDGRTLHADEESYPTTRVGESGVEQDPHAWLRALEATMLRVPETLRRRVAGVGVDGHVPSLVAVDTHGAPVAPSIIWQDARPTAEAAMLEQRVGDARFAIGIRLPWNASQLPAKALWLRRNAPEAAARTRWLLSPKDFVNHYLTGEYASDPWTMKGLSHVRTATPASAVLAAAGWPDDAVPPLRTPWEVLAGLRTTAAERLGLTAGIPVAVGWTDAMAAALASDVFGRPTGMVHTGTSEIVGASAPDADDVEAVYLVPREVAPLALSYGPTRLSGGSLLWIAGILNLRVDATLDAAAAAAEDRPLFLPYLGGERAPLWNTRVRGVFLGLDDRHGPGELAAAVIDGVALSAWHVLEAAERATGTPVADVQLGGRGVEHPAWLRARSGALGRELAVHTEQSLAAWGAAQLAATAAGQRMPDAAERATIRRHSPDVRAASRWDERRRAYLDAVEVALDWSRS